mmetsp:Transcript_17747/g.26464  ORF Transcript_17747/g.26464 Transcript_17747/m.26464 type:complete len:719 (-) Transcript_17747:33-2189(-)
MSESSTMLIVERKEHRRQEEEAMDLQITHDKASEAPLCAQHTKQSAEEAACGPFMRASQQRRRRMRSAATAVLCASVLLSPVQCSAFLPNSAPFGARLPLSRESPAAVAAATVSVEAVRKRKGDFVSTTADVAIANSKVTRESLQSSVRAQKVIKRRKQQQTEAPVVLAVPTVQPKKKTEAILAAAAKAAVADVVINAEEAQTFGRSVFASFSSAYSQSSYDFIESSEVISEVTSEVTSSQPQRKITTKITNKDNSKKTESAVTHKIARLLVDDDGEEDNLAPDDSPEAANQLADRASFAKMSEEAKFKASLAVKKSLAQSELPQLQKKKDHPLTKPAKKKKADASAAMKHSKITRKEYMILEEKRQNRQRKPAESKKIRATVSETGSDSMGKYAKSMSNHELLRKEDEVVLGREIQILVKWEEERQRLEDQLDSTPTFAQWAEAVNTTVPSLKKQIRRSQRAKAAFIEANLRLVVTVARQTVKKNRSEISFQDACQEGIIGLTRACEKFDPERGFRFSTYAIWWVKKEIHKNVVEQSRTVRLPANAMKKINDIRINERVLMDEIGRKPTDEEIAKRCGLSVDRLQFYRNAARDVASLDKSIQARQGKGSSASGESNDKGTSMADLNAKDTSPSPTDLAASQMLREDVRRLIKTLSPKEQAVIRLRFGIDDGRPRSLDDIGKKFSVEKERVRKIEARALLKLRQPYRNENVKCYISDL